MNTNQHPTPAPDDKSDPDYLKLLFDEHIKFYQKEGLSFLPLNRDKTPALKSWREFQGRKPTEEEVNRWRSLFYSGDYNIGVVCGSVSDNLFAVDFDNRELLKKIFTGDLKDLFITLTGRGNHVLFKGHHPVKTIKFLDENGKEVMTIKGDRSYIVAPPSLHENGVRYKVVREQKEIPRVDEKEFINRIVQKAISIGLKPMGKLEKINIEEILKGAPEGGRDNALLYIITFLQRQGATKETATEICNKWDERNKPPLGEAYIREKIDYHYEHEPYCYFFTHNPQEWKITDEATLKRQEKKTLKIEKINSTEDVKAEIEKLENNGQKLKILDLVRLCLPILEKERYIATTDTETLYRYDPEEGIYKEADGWVKAKVEEIVGERATGYLKNEIIGHLTSRNYKDRQEINSEEMIVPVKNGLLNLKDYTLERFTPERIFTYKLPVVFNPSAYHKRLDLFLDEVSSKPQDRETLEEIVGYCLYPGYPYQKAFMLTGEGNNGKSTFLSMLTCMLGKENVSNRSLQEINYDRFSKADLYNKKANISADIPPTKLMVTGTFKMLTGGDQITAEYKFHNSFTFINSAKLIFSANTIPDVPDDDTDAFFRRWVLLTFNNTFDGDKADPDILKKMTTDDGLSYLLNLGLAGLKRLLHRGGFRTDTTDEIRTNWRKLSNPVYAFVEDHIQGDEEATIEKQVLYSLFCKYCREENLKIVSQDTFFKTIPRCVIVEECRIQKVNEDGFIERPRAFKKIRYVESKEDDAEEDAVNNMNDEEAKDLEYYEEMMVLKNIIEQAQKKNGGVVLETDAISLAGKEGMKEEDAKELLVSLKVLGDVINIGDGFIKVV